MAEPGAKEPSGLGPSATAAMDLQFLCAQFLYREAALLDAWKLDEWLDLFVEGATYEVPCAGAARDVDSGTSLFYISDDWDRLRHRVKRLKKDAAHSEFPKSKCVRSISGVTVTPLDAETLEVESVFLTFRSKGDITDQFVGRHLYRLLHRDGALKIASKRTYLAMNSLRPQGRLSIVV